MCVCVREYSDCVFTNVTLSSHEVKRSPDNRTLTLSQKSIIVHTEDFLKGFLTLGLPEGDGSHCVLVLGTYLVTNLCKGRTPAVPISQMK